MAEISFLPQDSSKSKSSSDNESAHSTLPPLADVEKNVYCFGILLLESFLEISNTWKNKGPSKNCIGYLIDPTLKSFKNNELDLICKTIQECIQPDPRQRPTMKDITSKLREVIAISPDQATPRHSVLGFPKLNRAELETACEDFSNIIDTLAGCIVYKGTLSSGVEIAVASSLVASSKDWSKNAEMSYRKKVYLFVVTELKI
ncbi:hypothetical protein GH714_013860 [Hevea brasiliensis]|uniref:Serine-threonine/tyrosine-protein kinase catalytic domain-containing protein n=1 Tax=Hevea brasiliensis TaxID=3981 RepID=A0A6A6LNU7_HEVBR|nr:hypothetical protein GH714_013860 [Hevea brasiliensis]